MDLPLTGEQNAYLTLGRQGHGCIPLYFRLRRGVLDYDALARALDFVIRRHDALRIRLVPEPGAPCGYAQRLEVAGPAWDAAVRDEVAEEQVQGYASQFAMRPMDLVAGPAVDLRVAAISTGGHLVLLNVHHLATDAWGGRLIARDLWTAYGAYLTGVTPDMSSAHSFADHVRERQSAGEQLPEAEVEYWTRNWARIPGPALPSRRRGGESGDGSAGATSPRSVAAPGRTGPAVAIGPEDLVRVTEFARSARVTVQTVFFSAFVLALWSAYGPDEFVVSVGYLGRETRKAMTTVGIFERRVPVRVRVSGAANLADTVRAVMRCWGAAIRHAAPPFSVPLIKAELADRGIVCPGNHVEALFNPVVLPPGTASAGGPGISYLDVMPDRWAWFDEPRIRVTAMNVRAPKLVPIYSTNYIAPETVASLIRRLGQVMNEFTSGNATRPVGDLMSRQRDRS